MSLSTRLHAVAAVDPDHWALQQDHAQLRWSDLSRVAEGLEAAARKAGLTEGACICVIVRNSLECAAGVIGVLMAGRPVVYVSGLHAEAKRLEELRSLRPAMLVGAAADLTPAVLQELRASGAVGAAIGADGSVTLHPETPTCGEGPFFEPEPDACVVMRTSGTTGAPKLICLGAAIVEQGLIEGTRGRDGDSRVPSKIARSPTLLFAPLFHASGTFALLLSVFEGRPVVIFEKFKVDTLREALRLYPVRFLSMPPAVLRMVLDSSLTREDLTSIIAVRAGTAPLDPRVQAEFEERFGIPVLTTYGATEFMGALARWTLDDHRAFSAAKRGSVGRVSEGVELQLVDQETGAPAPVDGVGLIEVRGPRVGSRTWIRTNDLGRLDADGFLWVVGRADDAIIRGGFKVLANEVAKVLCEHEAIAEACVIGLPDNRLGEVPVAAVEPREGVTPPSAEELTTFARERLAPYQVPAEILVVAKLPRTVSLKVSRPEVRALFEDRRAVAAPALQKEG
jgi:acyl-CoA synthetase (AMP-forming)/AMP-acid ligase II